MPPWTISASSLDAGLFYVLCSKMNGAFVGGRDSGELLCEDGESEMKVKTRMETRIDADMKRPGYGEAECYGQGGTNRVTDHVATGTGREDIRYVCFSIDHVVLLQRFRR